MKIADVEIPYEEERGFAYRFFEILPGVLSYSIIFAPIILGMINPTAAAYFIIAYILIWFFKAMAMSRRVLQGYKRVKTAAKIDWLQMVEDVRKPKEALKRLEGNVNKIERIHKANLQTYIDHGDHKIQPDDIIHVVMIATYNEDPEIVEPTIQSVIDAHVDTKKNVMLYLAYEERAGERKAKQTFASINKYKDHFFHAEAVGHPADLPGEIVGKGGNITYCGRKLAMWVAKEKIDPERVLVTTLDADNRPDKNYFAALTYAYVLSEQRKYKSYQPVALYINNVWETPTIPRLIGATNSYYHIANANRLHAIRNFSAHAQGLDALIETDFWSVRTIVEDGHQFWRTYFKFDGRHDVIPLFVPIYQDAVLADTWRKTIRGQFLQLRRWTYGASDIAYVATRGWFIKNKINKWDLLSKFSRLLEGHVSWATASLILAFAGWVPLYFNANSDESIVALQLPFVISRINTIAVLGILISMVVTLLTLPKRPKEYGWFKHALQVIQWALVPVIAIIFHSFSAFYSQTRLALGIYIGNFDVTEKATKLAKKKEKSA